MKPKHALFVTRNDCKQTHEDTPAIDNEDLFVQFNLSIIKNQRIKNILTAGRNAVLLHGAAERIISAWQHLAVHCPIHLRPIEKRFLEIKHPLDQHWAPRTIITAYTVSDQTESHAQ